MTKKIQVIILIIILILCIPVVQINAANISVEGVSLNKTSVNIEIGQTEQLQAIFQPQNATNQKVRWSSSNSNVVSVTANGQIKGISKGVATITVTTEEKGYNATCTVNVSGTSKITSEKYSITVEDSQIGGQVNYIKGISPNTKLSDFKGNINTYSSISVKDLMNKQIGDDDIIATGMTLQLADNSTYILSVTGDLNSDGKISIIDLSRFKAFIVGLTTLDEPQEHAADINYDGRSSIVDLSQLKQVLTGLIEL